MSHCQRSKLSSYTWIWLLSCSSSACVLFVADLFHPVDGFAVELFLNRDMGHRRDWSGAVPMLLTRRNPDDVTRPNLLDRPSPALCPATTSRHDQGLTERVRVPCGSGTGLEGDTGADSAGRSVRTKQRITMHCAREILRRSFAGRLRSASLDFH